jgi:molybdenum cofactor cytidylyltransferase
VPERSDKPCAIGVVILAAGSSRRMGRPKLLLPWRTTTVLGHLLHQWTQLRAAQVAVVTAPDATDLKSELDRLGFPEQDRIINPAPDRGMFSSIQCTAAWSGWKTGLTHWIISLGDQPQLRPETLQRLVAFSAANPDNICQPMRRGRRRHPVLLPQPAFAALKECTATDLKQFLASRATELAGFESDDAGLDFDLDTPADYDRARREFE